MNTKSSYFLSRVKKWGCEASLSNSTHAHTHSYAHVPVLQLYRYYRYYSCTGTTGTTTVPVLRYRY
eukprot:COSAG05_NODE_99_length_19400_cov_50.107559_11_plen_66_part_00